MCILEQNNSFIQYCIAIIPISFDLNEFLIVGYLILSSEIKHIESIKIPFSPLSRAIRSHLWKINCFECIQANSCSSFSTIIIAPHPPITLNPDVKSQYIGGNDSAVGNQLKSKRKKCYKYKIFHNSTESKSVTEKTFKIQ